jgi:hypothetical protein
MADTLFSETLPETHENESIYMPLGDVDPGTGKRIFWIGEDDLRKNFNHLFVMAAISHSREDFYITALRNMFRKANFLELYQQLQNGDLSEEEFQNEVESKPNKYTIEMNKDITASQFKTIVSLISHIGFDVRDMSLTDVAELFSAKLDSLLPFTHDNSLITRE